jgi:hypothetical protein
MRRVKEYHNVSPIVHYPNVTCILSPAIIVPFGESDVNDRKKPLRW